MNLKGYLIAGLATAVPLFLTIYVLFFLIRIFDGMSQPLVLLILGKEVPGLGLVVTLVVLILLGMFVSVTVGRKSAEMVDRIMLKLPLSRSVYSVAKNVVDTFFSGKKEFGKPVMVRFMPEVYAIGFITGKAPQGTAVEASSRLSNVYIPTALNPTQGMLLMISEDRVVPLNMSFDKAMELVISAGLSGSQDRDE
jgi:uncharacterized membrane protein